MGDINKNINSTTIVFTSIMVLAIVGLVTLIIFGNLQGNLGFDRESELIVNESIGELNDTATVLSNFSRVGYVSLVVTEVTNQTEESSIIPVGNYTVDSVLGTINGTAGAGVGDAFANVTVTYTVTFRGLTELDTDDVITNITGGVTEFFDFATTWFVLLGVALLVIIAFSLVGVVQSRGGGGGRSSKGGSVGSRFAS